ncbi:hypothetical protein HDU67_006272 [Dinochytrium kinnereticum]|nr:hypothetical protein HDU67_006272 [Dinochytrium kinnereticum]
MKREIDEVDDGGDVDETTAIACECPAGNEAGGDDEDRWDDRDSAEGGDSAHKKTSVEGVEDTDIDKQIENFDTEEEKYSTIDRPL